MPGESIIEDSTQQRTGGLKPTYAVVLTNRRAAFRFNGFGSSMTQSFLYDEITMAHPVARMFIPYLELKTRTKTYYLHIPEPGYWSSKILDAKARETASHDATAPADDGAPLARRKRQELLVMLAELRKHGILSAAELEEKKRQIDQLQF
jgi:hypothetical protein